MSFKNFRLIAIAEATSFLALLVASYLKHAHDEPAGVEILGPIHGILFLAYVALALGIREQMRWSARTTALVLASAVLPFGGYAADWWLRTDRGEPQRG
jgi:integral membrane protein